MHPGCLADMFDCRPHLFEEPGCTNLVHPACKVAFEDRFTQNIQDAGLVCYQHSACYEELKNSLFPAAAAAPSAVVPTKTALSSTIAVVPTKTALSSTILPTSSSSQPASLNITTDSNGVKHTVLKGIEYTVGDNLSFHPVTNESNAVAVASTTQQYHDTDESNPIATNYSTLSKFGSAGLLMRQLMKKYVYFMILQ